MKRWLVKQSWPTGDKRRCRRCANGGTVQGHRNGYAVVWKCECGAKTAIRYAQTSKHYKDGDIEECLMAVGDEEHIRPIYTTVEENSCPLQPYPERHLPTNTTTRRNGNDNDNDDCDDDEIARLDTMCTSTMHGDDWLIRFRRLLRRRYGLNVETHDCNVRYRFGGGEKKIATKRDVFPVAKAAGVCASRTLHPEALWRCRRRRTRPWSVTRSWSTRPLRRMS